MFIITFTNLLNKLICRMDFVEKYRKISLFISLLPLIISDYNLKASFSLFSCFSDVCLANFVKL